MSRGAPKAPITYEGEYDATRTYLPLRIATKAGVAYLSIATSTGVDPGTDPTVWLPLGGGGGAAITPGGQRVVDLLFPSGQTFASDGFGVHAATGWSPASAHAATATAVSGSQVLLCTDGVPATYHVTVEPDFFRSTFVGLASQFAVYLELNGGWFAYVQSGPPPGNSSAFGFTRYTFGAFRPCIPGEAINASDLSVSLLDDVGNTYRLNGDNAAVTITRMPA